MIIAFTGKKRSGKTEAAKAIDLPSLNFKDPLIAEVRENFKELLAEIQYMESGNALIELHTLFDTKPPLIRKLLQNYGTDVRRNDTPRYWVDKWEERAMDLKNCVTDDVRFLNEAEMVKDMDGIVIRIERPGLKTTDTHISEQEMEEIVADYTVVNDGTIEELKDKIHAIYKIQQNTRTT